MATTPDSRSTSAPGESKNDHFKDAISKLTGVYNGMNDEPDTPRFGATDYYDD